MLREEDTEDTDSGDAREAAVAEGGAVGGEPPGELCRLLLDMIEKIITRRW
jgi:hypothetical protein